MLGIVSLGLEFRLKLGVVTLLVAAHSGLVGWRGAQLGFVCTTWEALRTWDEG